MKKAISLFLVTLLLVLTASSALADTERVECDYFSIELDPSCLQTKDMPAEGGTFAQYFPGLPCGDSGSNIAYIWRPATVDLNNPEEIVQKTAESIFSAFSKTRDVTDFGILSYESVTIGGEPGLYFNTYITYNQQISETKTAALTLFQFTIIVPRDNGTMTFSYQSLTPQTVSYAFSSLDTLIWK